MIDTSDEATLDQEMEKDTDSVLPAYLVIRKRLAAKTIGVHLSALPPELQALKSTDNTSNPSYLTRRDLPENINLTIFGGDKKTFSRDEVWKLADDAGSKLEWDQLPNTLSGKATALFSTTGQGIYANYGRPTMDFSGFFHDYLSTSRQLSGNAIASQGSVMLGPIFIAADTISAAGFTALGHITRGAQLTDKTVFTDILSTGVYEGTTSWTSAKLGVLTGAKAIRLAVAAPIPGAHLVAIPIGFLVGATTAIFAKHFANKHKNKAIDAFHNPAVSSKPSDTGLQTNPE